MKSINFEMLRPDWPDLASLGGFAEEYALPDPSTSLVKLRSFAEVMVQIIYRQLALPKPIQPNLIDLLNSGGFVGVTPKVVLDKFHAIRIHGNKAAHGESGSMKLALQLVQQAHDLARWFFVTFGKGKADQCPAFISPETQAASDDRKGKLKKDKREILEKLAAQEARMQSLLEELEKSRAEQTAAQKRAEELEAFASRATEVADRLQFDEASTRQWLLDSQLQDAGWEVGANGTTTEEVGQEVEVPFQPTGNGLGYADYVLWNDDGRPLAVIEVKKTSKKAELGRHQARLYADGLEKKYDQRPVIFYSNGFDIWIWDDAQQYPPRKLFGFYSKDSLLYLVQQRTLKKPLDSIAPKPEITDRLYQLEAIKRVTERFSGQHRKTLVVQATGTGKTRVAIGLADLLIRAGWAKRILFLCDRRELRRQAKNAFGYFTREPLTVVNAGTAKDRDQRIYLATYPAMLKIYQTFDVGFFDLVIADESHRSIYNVYGDLFRYFDALQVGLTATPVELVSRSTCRLFDCEFKHPTVNYDLERAVAERCLVPFEVYTHTTQFLREGIDADELTDDQIAQLEDQGIDPNVIDFDAEEIDKQIYNKDTNRSILRNLMEKGIRDATGQAPGKSIIFARNHTHAMLLQQLFDELYPQYAGKFCQVIDNYDPRAEQLIDDFKGTGSNDELTIAISVDMLDTGIDIPEVVNLVFAKPVKSKVKFWQMIGRGTRLCPDLFGPGKDKSCFRIFDHWGNFDYFDFHYQETEPIVSKSLMQTVFEARIQLAETALQHGNLPSFEIAIGLIAADLNALPEESIAVREKWREKRSLSQADVLKRFAPATKHALLNEMAPLMQWINLRGFGEAHQFDLLIARMQIELLRKSSRFEDLKAELLDWVNSLQVNLNPVIEKQAELERVRGDSFWRNVTVDALEQVRQQLRGIMHHRQRNVYKSPKPLVVDVKEDEEEYQYNKRSASLKTIDMKAYERRVEAVLKDLFLTDLTLKKIRAGLPVNESDLKALTSLVLTQHPDVNLSVLEEFYADTAKPLDAIIRSLVGMEPEVVKTRFAQFAQKHPSLNSKQLRFLSLLQNHISQHGSIELERLYEDPFTLIDSGGLDAIFPAEVQVNELIEIIQTFRPPLGASVGERKS